MSYTIHDAEVPQQSAPLPLAVLGFPSRRKSGHDKTPCITDLAALATVTSPRHEDYDASDDDSDGDDDGSDHGHRDGGANADNSDNGT